MSQTLRLMVSDVRLADDTEPVRFAVAASECVALLAGGGMAAASAVSRLMDVLAGHAGSGGGRVLVDGADVTTLPPASRRIGILSERDPLFGHLSVRGNVAFPLVVRRVPEPDRSVRVDRTLALLDLEAASRRRPDTLDPAEAVRARLARALACDPAVLLLDDALASVAPGRRREMHQRLRRLARARGIGLVLATRDRDEALAVGDRIGLLADGALRQIGSAAELLDHPADESVAVGFGESNSLPGHVEWIENDVARVRLGAGASMEAMASSTLAAGGLCVVCVRPERIAVAFVSGGTSALGGDALSATLSDAAHLGDHVRLRFRLEGGGELLVRRPASQPTASLRLDRPALLAWQAAHATAFPMGG